MPGEKGYTLFLKNIGSGTIFFQAFSSSFFFFFLFALFLSSFSLNRSFSTYRAKTLKNNEIRFLSVFLFFSSLGYAKH
jgi:hypothetical protein